MDEANFLHSKVYKIFNIKKNMGNVKIIMIRWKVLLKIYAIL